MRQLPPLIPDITIWRDTLAERWRLESPDQTYSLTAWDWSQRRQLVRSAVVAGEFQRQTFVQEVFAWLVDPTPPPDALELAYACLYLLNVPQQRPSVSLLQAELLLAQAFGWRPGDLQGQPISSLDEMVAALAPGPAPQDGQTADPEGWISIQVVDDVTAAPPPVAGGPEIAAGLEQMLAAVQVWAGLAADPLPAGEPDQHAPASTELAPQPAERSAHVAPDSLPTDRPAPATPEADFPPQEAPPAQPTAFADESPPPPGMSRFNRPVRLPAPNPPSPQRAKSRPLSAAVPALGFPDPPQVSPQREPMSRAEQEPGSPPDERVPAESPLLPVPHIWQLPMAAKAESPFPESSLTEPSSEPRQKGDWAPLYRGAVEQPDQATALTLLKPREPMTSPGTQPVAIAPSQSPAAVAPLAEQSRTSPLTQDTGHLQTPWNTPGKLLPLPPAPQEDPFALSQFEDQLADALERAAREAGVDLP